jgi:hypothetical protein
VDSITLRNIDIITGIAVESGERRVHIDAMLGTIGFVRLRTSGQLGGREAQLNRELSPAL